jgi:hypothetical protein
MKKRDLPEWMTDGQSVANSLQPEAAELICNFFGVTAEIGEGNGESLSRLPVEKLRIHRNTQRRQIQDLTLDLAGLRQKRRPLVQILYVGPLMPADYFVCYIEASEELCLHGLSERYPESVDVTNDELTCAVEGIIKVFDDLNPVLKASIQVIDVIGSYVQVDLPTVVRARPPACVEHDFAVSE